MDKPLRIVPCLLAALVAVAPSAAGQALSIQGTQFAVDGTPKFLTFITYFGAMGAPHVVDDRRFLKRMGFDGVRIWPNLDTGPQLMNGDGSTSRTNATSAIADI